MLVELDVTLEGSLAMAKLVESVVISVPFISASGKSVSMVKLKLPSCNNDSEPTDSNLSMIADNFTLIAAGDDTLPSVTVTVSLSVLCCVVL